MDNIETIERDMYIEIIEEKVWKQELEVRFVGYGLCIEHSGVAPLTHHERILYYVLL